MGEMQSILEPYEEWSPRTHQVTPATCVLRPRRGGRKPKGRSLRRHRPAHTLTSAQPGEPCGPGVGLGPPRPRDPVLAV